MVIILVMINVHDHLACVSNVVPKEEVCDDSMHIELFVVYGDGMIPIASRFPANTKLPIEEDASMRCKLPDV